MYTSVTWFTYIVEIVLTPILARVFRFKPSISGTLPFFRSNGRIFTRIKYRSF